MFKKRARQTMVFIYFATKCHSILPPSFPRRETARQANTDGPGDATCVSLRLIS